MKLRLPVILCLTGLLIGAVCVAPLRAEDKLRVLTVSITGNEAYDQARLQQLMLTIPPTGALLP